MALVLIPAGLFKVRPEPVSGSLAFRTFLMAAGGSFFEFA